MGESEDNLRMFLIILSTVVTLASSTPQWQDLNCEAGHKYLFSEVEMTWEEARGECELYGGWLVDLKSRKEQNCILRYAQTAGVTETWYWHDVNNVETPGIFKHAKDDTEVEWMADWSCNKDSNLVFRGNEYVKLGIWFKTYPMVTGFWCDGSATERQHYICESLI